MVGILTLFSLFLPLVQVTSVFETINLGYFSKGFDSDGAIYLVLLGVLVALSAAGFIVSFFAPEKVAAVFRSVVGCCSSCISVAVLAGSLVTLVSLNEHIAELNSGDEMAIGGFQIGAIAIPGLAVVVLLMSLALCVPYELFVKRKKRQ